MSAESALRRPGERRRLPSVDQSSRIWARSPERLGPARRSSWCWNLQRQPPGLVQPTIGNPWCLERQEAGVHQRLDLGAGAGARNDADGVEPAARRLRLEQACHDVESPSRRWTGLTSRYANLRWPPRGGRRDVLFDAEGLAHGWGEFAAAVEQPGPESHDFRQRKVRWRRHEEPGVSLLHARKHRTYQAAGGNVGRHQRPAGQRNALALFDGDEGRRGIFHRRAGVGTRRIAADPAQPVLPRLRAAVDQGVARKICDRLDRTEPGEQYGAADREHVFVEQALGLEAGPLAGTVDDGGVEIVPTEVEAGSAWRPESNLDLGVPARKLAEARQQPALQEFVRHAEIEHAADALATDAFDRAAQLFESAADARQQFGSFLGEGHGARVTTEQGHADVGFERLDLRADRRGGDAEFPGRRGEAQVRGDSLEDAQGVQRYAVRRGRHRLPSSKMTINNTVRIPVIKGHSKTPPDRSVSSRPSPPTPR